MKRLAKLLTGRLKVPAADIKQFLAYQLTSPAYQALV